MFPTAGETDAEVLDDLSTLFNSLFSSDGLNATFDPFTDSLFLDQQLTPFESLFTQNTDPGLELDPFLSSVPQPSTLLLLGMGLAGLAGVRGYRRRQGRNSTTAARQERIWYRDLPLH